MIAFDDVAFVALGYGAMLSPLRRRIVLKGRPVDFAVQVSSSGGCVLEERLSGMRARLMAGSTGTSPDAMSSAGPGEDRPQVADRVAHALASAGWT